MHKNKLANFFIALIIVGIVAIVGFVLPKLTYKSLSDPAAVEEKVAQTINLKIYTGDSKKVLEFDDVKINNNENLFNIMLRVTTQNNIEFSYKDFGGDLGMFIESINNSSEQNSKTKWWQYWVNEEYAQVGVSSYQVKAGDIIVFRFTADEETE